MNDRDYQAFIEQLPHDDRMQIEYDDQQQLQDLSLIKTDDLPYEELA